MSKITIKDIFVGLIVTLIAGLGSFMFTKSVAVNNKADIEYVKHVEENLERKFKEADRLVEDRLVRALEIQDKNLREMQEQQKQYFDKVIELLKK